MQVRNHTGIDQVVSGVKLPAGKWLQAPTDLPLEVAMDALQLRLVDVKPATTGTDGLFWMSALSQGDGYGTAAENYLLELRHMDSLVVRDCWFRLDEGLDAYTIEQLRKPVSVLPEYGLCMATPGEFRKLPTKIRVGFTMYESDDPLRFHPEWAHECRFVDKLIVPSEYSKNVFAEFYDGPIDVCDLIVHKDFYTAQRRVRKETFKFVTYGTLNGRKSPYETVFAFLAAFPKEEYPDVRLELKTRGAIFGGSKGHIPTLEDPRIKIIDQTWDRKTLLDWLHGADCMLFATKGEGYGMPPREAICTGLPTIYGHHTGMVDLEDYAIPVMVDKEEDCPIGGKWSVPDWEHLIEQMRHVYEHAEDEYILAEHAAVNYVRDHNNAAKRLLGLIKGTKHHEFTASGNETDLEFFYKKVREEVTGRILCIGTEGSAELGALGCRVWVADGDPLLINRDNTPKVDAVVSVNLFQKYHYEEVGRMLKAWKQMAPVYFTVPSAWNRNWTEAGAYLRQQGEWKEILKGYNAPTEYYNGKNFLMGRVLGNAIRAEGVRMGMYFNGAWRPEVIE